MVTVQGKTQAGGKSRVSDPSHRTGPSDQGATGPGHPAGHYQRSLSRARLTGALTLATGKSRVSVLSHWTGPLTGSGSRAGGPLPAVTVPGRTHLSTDAGCREVTSLCPGPPHRAIGPGPAGHRTGPQGRWRAIIHSTPGVGITAWSTRMGRLGAMNIL